MKRNKILIMCVALAVVAAGAVAVRRGQGATAREQQALTTVALLGLIGAALSLNGKWRWLSALPVVGLGLVWTSHAEKLAEGEPVMGNKTRSEVASEQKALAATLDDKPEDYWWAITPTEPPVTADDGTRLYPFALYVAAPNGEGTGGKPPEWSRVGTGVVAANDKGEVGLADETGENLPLWVEPVADLKDKIVDIVADQRSAPEMVQAFNAAMRTILANKKSSAQVFIVGDEAVDFAPIVLSKRAVSALEGKDAAAALPAAQGEAGEAAPPAIAKSGATPSVPAAWSGAGAGAVATPPGTLKMGDDGAPAGPATNFIDVANNARAAAEKALERVLPEALPAMRQGRATELSFWAFDHEMQAKDGPRWWLPIVIEDYLNDPTSEPKPLVALAQRLAVLNKAHDGLAPLGSQKREEALDTSSLMVHVNRILEANGNPNVAQADSQSGAGEGTPAGDAAPAPLPATTPDPRNPTQLNAMIEGYTGRGNDYGIAFRLVDPAKVNLPVARGRLVNNEQELRLDWNVPPMPDAVALWVQALPGIEVSSQRLFNALVRWFRSQGVRVHSASGYGGHPSAPAGNEATPLPTPAEGAVEPQSVAQDSAAA